MKKRIREKKTIKQRIIEFVEQNVFSVQKNDLEGNIDDCE